MDGEKHHPESPGCGAECLPEKRNIREGTVPVRRTRKPAESDQQKQKKPRIDVPGSNEGHAEPQPQANERNQDKETENDSEISRGRIVRFGFPPDFDFGFDRSSRRLAENEVRLVARVGVRERLTQLPARGEGPAVQGENLIAAKRAAANSPRRGL